MNQVQDKIIKDIVKTVEKAGLEALIATEFANTGTLSIQHPQIVEELFKVIYNFQDSYCYLTIKSDGRENNYVYYFENSSTYTKFKGMLEQAIFNHQS
jgi:hypothetical protein